jgi:hypothetical protein
MLACGLPVPLAPLKHWLAHGTACTLSAVLQHHHLGQCSTQLCEATQQVAQQIQQSIHLLCRWLQSTTWLCILLSSSKALGDACCSCWCTSCRCRASMT